MTPLRILVVEDDGLVAMSMEDLLEELGCEVALSAGGVAETLRWLNDGGAADGALLDVTLSGEMVFPVAEALVRRGMPFAFTSGYGESPDPRFRDKPLLGKPLKRAPLKTWLEGLQPALKPTP